MYDRDNDAQRIFREDSREKKRTAIGIHSRASRRGYIRGGIKTQSDFLSAKERKKLNGEVKVYYMWDKYKDLNNCNLDEIFKKSDDEIKQILTVMKENNSSTKIFKHFGISNGTLYNYYYRYGILLPPQTKKGKMSKEQIENKLGTDLIPYLQFKLKDAMQKGEYLANICSKNKISLEDLSEYWNVGKSTLGRYTSIYNKAKREKIHKQIEIPKIDTSANDLMQSRIDELTMINEKLISENIELSDKLSAFIVENTSSFKIELNGEFTKSELGNRLTSINDLILENGKYRIKMSLEEI